MDFRNIKTFVRVSECKSFTRAAEQMNYVQSTVTMQIQQLERELGYPLFDRIGKKVSLTALGTEFLAHAYKILHIMEKAENADKDIGNLHGVLRVGVSESIMFGMLIDLLPKLKEKYKNLSLSIKTAHTTALLEELKQNQLDIVYISKGLNTDPDLCCHYARKENIIFVSGNGHILANRSKISPQEIFKHEFLVTEHEGICYGRLREIAAQCGETILESVEVDSVFVITKLAQKNMGLTFLPEYSVAHQIENGDLARIDADIPEQTYYSQVLSHKDRWISPFMASLIEMIKENRPE